MCKQRRKNQRHPEWKEKEGEREALEIRLAIDHRPTRASARTWGHFPTRGSTIYPLFICGSTGKRSIPVAARLTSACSPAYWRRLCPARASLSKLFILRFLSFPFFPSFLPRDPQRFIFAAGQSLLVRRKRRPRLTTRHARDSSSNAFLISNKSGERLHSSIQSIFAGGKFLQAFNRSKLLQAITGDAFSPARNTSEILLVEAL